MKYGRRMLDWSSYTLAKGIGLAPSWLRKLLLLIIFALLIVIPHPYRKRIRVSVDTFFPHYGYLAKEKLIYKNMYQSLAILFDILAMWFRGKEWTAKQVKKVHNEHLINDAVQNNRNVIFVSYHFGNWEVLAPYLTSKFHCCNLYKAASNKYINNVIQKYRTSCNIIGFEVNNKIAIKNIMRSFRRDNNIGLMFLPDQRPQGDSSYLMSNFYGIKIPFNLLAGKLVTAVDCDVILICGLRKKDGSYEIFMKQPSKEIYSKDPSVSVNAMNKGFEELINLDITQYNWLQDKFKHEKRRQI